jgi:hypothetical protein
VVALRQTRVRPVKRDVECIAGAILVEEGCKTGMRGLTRIWTNRIRHAQLAHCNVSRRQRANGCPSMEGLRQPHCRAMGVPIWAA